MTQTASLFLTFCKEVAICDMYPDGRRIVFVVEVLRRCERR